jgi:hypothetical protein
LESLINSYNLLKGKDDLQVVVFAFIVETFLLAEDKILASQQSFGILIVLLTELIG